MEHVRFALRQMRKNPGFALLAIVTLALGIGANTAMFTVIDSVMLRPLPYPHSDEIVAITAGLPSVGHDVDSTSWLNYQDIRRQAREMSSVAAYAIDFSVVHTSESSDATTAVKVTASMLDVLGIKPALGRAFTDADNQRGAAGTAMLTNEFWRSHLNSDSQAVGRQVKIGDDPFTVIGVLPADLRFGGADASKGIWVAYQPGAEAERERNSNFLYLLGRLRDGVSPEAAQAELTSIARGIAQSDPEHAKDLTLRLIPYRYVVTRQVKPVFLALIAVLALVLLIACANVANLQLARCLARSQELAVRAALGATRASLLFQMLVEGAVLCCVGALAGIGLAEWMLDAVRHLPPDLIPRAEEIHLRLSVFLMLLAITILVTLLSSIAPAVVATMSDPQSVLQAGTRGASGSRGRSRLGSMMVAGEVALSVILLVSGGLLFRTLYNLQHAYLGFEQDNITRFIAFPGNAAGFFSMKQAASGNQEDSIAIRRYEPMRQDLQRLPGVVDVGFASALPFEGIDMRSSFSVAGQPKPQDKTAAPRALLRAVSGSYTRVMQIPILRGRAITEQDSGSTAFVATINQTLAQRFFAGKDAIGQQIEFARDEKDRLQSGMIKPYTIVGVTADSMQGHIAEAIEPEIDLPAAQVPVKSFYYSILVSPETNYVLRTHGPVEITSAIRSAFHDAAPDFALDDFQTMQAAHDQADFNQRLGLGLVGSFALIAVIMVLAGLYGVLSQIVGQRRREIAIRMALGADRSSILNMILQRGFLLIATGSVLGLAAAAGVTQWVKSFLYGVAPIDALTYVSVVVVLAVVGAIAAAIPARRAAKVDPMVALRAE